MDADWCKFSEVSNRGSAACLSAGDLSSCGISKVLGQVPVRGCPGSAEVHAPPCPPKLWVTLNSNSVFLGLGLDTELPFAGLRESPQPALPKQTAANTRLFRALGQTLASFQYCTVRTL